MNIHQKSEREAGVMSPTRDDFVGAGSWIARHIGNAVPPALAERIGRHLSKLHYGKI
jgi:site-specific DNA-cytosine methylase